MSLENVHENPSLAHWLRRIQLQWDLSPDALSKISHTDINVMTRYLNKTKDELDALPTIPEGLATAAPLVSIFKNLARTVPDVEKQKEWLITANDIFEGNKPIEVMAMSPAHVAWISYTLESSAQQQI